MGIRMKYTLTGRLIGKSLKEFSELPNSSFSPGGFAMDIPVGGRTVCVPFDWASYSGTVNEDGELEITHGERTYFSTTDENELDDCYEEEWKKLGICRDDLTPEVMAKATAIREFYIDYWPVSANADSDDTLTVTKLCFLDDDGTEYPVDDAVLKAAGNLLNL